MREIPHIIDSVNNTRKIFLNPILALHPYQKWLQMKNIFTVEKFSNPFRETRRENSKNSLNLCKKLLGLEWPKTGVSENIFKFLPILD